MRIRLTVLLALGAVLLLPASAYACACCAESGHWSSATTRLGAHERAELDRVRFSPAATTYVTAAGLEGVKGVTSPAPRYNLVLAKSGRRWKLRLSSAAGRRGTLSFALPASAHAFAADLRNGGTASGGGPLLYKELRLAGAVAGTGDFLPRIRTARYRLILQGRGNACLSARDFTHWTLQVSGGGARFSLFGSLRRSAGA